jgi:hypothetical protein
MCKKELPLESFKKNVRRKDGLQSQCVECQQEYRRQHYEQNRKKYIDKANVWKKGFIEWWKEYKTTFSCAECGENHPACIQFHHHNADKDQNVANLVQWGCKQKVLKEIKKCTSLCANCHAKLHWKSE